MQEIPLREILLLVDLPQKEAITEARARGIEAIFIGYEKKSVILECFMDDYEKILDWYVYGGAQIRRTTSYRQLDGML